jgi:hypothetical protein
MQAGRPVRRDSSSKLDRPLEVPEFRGIGAFEPCLEAQLHRAFLSPRVAHARTARSGRARAGPAGRTDLQSMLEQSVPEPPTDRNQINQCCIEQWWRSDTPAARETSRAKNGGRPVCPARGGARGPGGPAAGLPRASRARHRRRCPGGHPGLCAHGDAPSCAARALRHGALACQRRPERAGGRAGGPHGPPAAHRRETAARDAPGSERRRAAGAVSQTWLAVCRVRRAARCSTHAPARAHCTADRGDWQKQWPPKHAPQQTSSADALRADSVRLRGAVSVPNRVCTFHRVRRQAAAAASRTDTPLSLLAANATNSTNSSGSPGNATTGTSKQAPLTLR